MENDILENYEDVISKIMKNEGIEEDKLNVQIIGCSLGNNVNITSGYKYVVIANTFWGGNFYDFIAKARLVDQTNGVILQSQVIQGKDSRDGAGTCLVFAKIEDINQNSVFKFDSSDFNIVLGIK
mgnify:CR=1 FL=1